ncbi:thioredoxin family protein [Pseudomonas asgharzadehiana]|uniref:thioredoxin family protein n=1 Tax=Pseudomonas asgharzadehiana TaxID=2842349 RepID=UPI0034D5B4ED
MGFAKTVINHPDEYWKIVNQLSLAFVLFVTEGCEACKGADKRFGLISEKYSSKVISIIVDPRETPKIDALGGIGTPTLVVYRNGQEARRFKGIGYPDDQEAYLTDIFNHYADNAPLPAYLMP